MNLFWSTTMGLYFITQALANTWHGLTDRMRESYVNRLVSGATDKAVTTTAVAFPVALNQEWASPDSSPPYLAQTAFEEMFNDDSNWTNSIAVHEVQDCASFSRRSDAEALMHSFPEELQQHLSPEAFY